MATLPGPCAHPTLLFYIFGPQSEAFSAKCATLTNEQDRNHFLTTFFRPYYSLLSNYDASSSACVPSSFIATDWLSDDLAGNGSYSNFQTGLEEGDIDIEIIREGLPGRSVWFAGEHVSPFVALGTVTGAYWSGEAVGRRIAQAYGLSTEVGEGFAEGVGAKDLEGDKEVNVRGFADKALKERD